MSSSYPGALDSFSNPSGASYQDDASVLHADQHANANDAIEALEAKLGTGSSTAAAGKVLRATGAGASAWGQVNVTTDVVGFTSADLQALLSDETGTGVAVFNDTPTILTPTIASFVNAVHTHQNSAGGGTLALAALAATAFSSQITPTSNGGSAGGTLNYVNLAGLKLAWGTTASKTNSAGASSNYDVTLTPAGFSSVAAGFCCLQVATGSVNNNGVNGISLSATTFTLGWFNDTGSAGVGGNAGWLVIGT